MHPTPDAFADPAQEACKPPELRPQGDTRYDRVIIGAGSMFTDKEGRGFMSKSISRIALLFLIAGTGSAHADVDTLLGFQLDFWDYVTFASMSTIVLSGLAAAVFILGLPGRIAIARKHPEADAIYLMGWIGFLAVVPWIQALMWAFKPTDVIDIRQMPAERQRETEAMIARLSGQAPPEAAPAQEEPAARGATP